MSQRNREYYIIPENFKKGKYFLSRFKPVDLVILLGGCSLGVIICIFVVYTAAEFKTMTLAVVGVSIGIIIILMSILLTLNIPYYHNILGKMTCKIRFMLKTKTYVYKGVDYLTYEERKNQKG